MPVLLPFSDKVIFLYNIFIYGYYFVLRVAALWNKKAKEWVEGRKKLYQDVAGQVSSSEKTVLIHCASAGEFEQGKPVIENLKSFYPNYKIIVSFFSPSGYAVGKKYKHADVVCYLPLDTPRNADKFIDLINPELVIFIKYDYWYHHLKTVSKRNIPLILVSSIFRENQPFFKWYGGLHKKMLHFFNHIFVQDEHSWELLKNINVSHCSLSGDTRFDRVTTIARNFSPIPIIEKFIGDSHVLIAGSTWPEDEQMIAETLASLDKDIKVIIAPHEITKDHVYNLLSLFPAAIPFSQADQGELHYIKTLVIDNIGMLSRLYAYANYTYIGGGFNKSGIHNTLEAAVYGKPVTFGPNYQKFKEAKGLIKAGAAFSVSNEKELKNVLAELSSSQEKTDNASIAAKHYVEKNRGATEKVINYIQEKRLLTN